MASSGNLGAFDGMWGVEGVGDKLVESAGAGVIDLHRRAVGAALEQALTRRQIEIVFGFLAAVALHAMLGVQRTNAFLKNLEATSHALGMVGWQRRVRRCFCGRCGDCASYCHTDHGHLLFSCPASVFSQ